MNNTPSTLASYAKSLKARHRAEARFKWIGRLAILVSCLFLFFLLSTIVAQGTSAFFYHYARLEVAIPEELPDNAGAYRKPLQDAILVQFPEVTKRKDTIVLTRLLGEGAALAVYTQAKTHPDWAGTTQSLWVPLSSQADMYFKDRFNRATPEYRRKLKDQPMDWLDNLKQNQRIEKRFSFDFLKLPNSTNPERAGIQGAIIGSLFTVICCMLLALPLGVFSAIYLEEFAPKNRFSTIIEVNINNLAAVPSIIFGLLGLAVYLNLFGMPRSSALVGGLTLALMVLPTIVITTRNALKAVPPSIRDAALALGASPMQVLLHHTLPLAMPGIMTGAILSVARALGETAPLLMIGMVAFIVDTPHSLFSPASVLPVQIYLWSDVPDLGFQEKTAAAILVLITLLVVINLCAVYLRKRTEKRW